MRSCYGVRMGFEADTPGVLESLIRLMPSCPCQEKGVLDLVFSIREEPAGNGSTQFEVAVNGTPLRGSFRIEEALQAIERLAPEAVALLSKEYVLVHAAVVGWQGGAILLPGPSGSGKSTLAMALVKAGATYYSDEYAILDSQGQVHPYLRAPNLRGHAGRDTAGHLANLLARGLTQPPLPVALVLVSRYSENADWQPCALTCREILFELFANTVAARYRPEFSLKTLKPVSLTARGVQTPRGDADRVATDVLSFMQSEN